MKQVWLLAAAATVFAVSAGSEIHKWVDKDGNVHFSDEPPTNRESEQIVLPESAVPPPDTGELRRRELLEQADIEAGRVVEGQRDRRLAAKSEAQARRDEYARCLDARIRLEILNEQVPVYRDSSGKLRAKSVYDTYSGPREYIDDFSREQEKAMVRRSILLRCADPDDPGARARARAAWIFAVRCDAARADLEVIERPQSKNPDDKIEAQRRRIELACGEAERYRRQESQ